MALRAPFAVTRVLSSVAVAAILLAGPSATSSPARAQSTLVAPGGQSRVTAPGGLRGRAAMKHHRHHRMHRRR